MNTPRGRRMLGVISLCGILVTAWFGHHAASDAYLYWKHGVEQPASVIALIHSGPGYSKRTTIYTYEIEVAGRKMNVDFPVLLSAGQSISVLVLPGKPDQGALGSRNSSLFEIFWNAFEVDEAADGVVLGVSTIVTCMFCFAGIMFSSRESPG